MLSPKKCIQNFRAWLHYTRYFRRVAKVVAGEHYYNNRQEIKDHIRNRVHCVLRGFDLVCQTQLFHSDMFEIARISQQMACSSTSQVMA